MDFGANKTPVEIIKGGAFEGTVLMESGTKSHLKNSIS